MKVGVGGVWNWYDGHGGAGAGVVDVAGPGRAAGHEQEPVGAVGLHAGGEAAGGRVDELRGRPLVDRAAEDVAGEQVAGEEGLSVESGDSFCAGGSRQDDRPIRLAGGGGRRQQGHGDQGRQNSSHHGSSFSERSSQVPHFPRDYRPTRCPSRFLLASVCAEKGTRCGRTKSGYLTSRAQRARACQAAVQRTPTRFKSDRGWESGTRHVGAEQLGYPVSSVPPGGVGHPVVGQR